MSSGVGGKGGGRKRYECFSFDFWSYPLRRLNGLSWRLFLILHEKHGNKFLRALISRDEDEKFSTFIVNTNVGKEDYISHHFHTISA
jgi:hypothetical protein